MSLAKSLIQGSGAALLVEEVFSAYLYEGNSTGQSLSNGIDLAGEGGMVWVKGRTNAFDHLLADTERGADNALASNNTAAEINSTAYINAFNSDGFTVGGSSLLNDTGNNYASWAFRKAPRFFDVVTYAGDGVAGREIAHSMGVVPGMMIVKRLNTTESWLVYHRSEGNTEYGFLNLTNAFATTSAWDNTAPTDSAFTLGGGSSENGSGSTYVAYIFAHDPLGPSGDGSDGMIACDSFTTDGSGEASISIGWEPQYVLVKSSDSADNWRILDTMRGFNAGGATDARLYANTTDIESLFDEFELTPGGFDVKSFAASKTYIYMAIRRPMGVPESASEVFAVDTADNTPTAPPWFTSGFPTDMAFFRQNTSVENNQIADRLRQGKSLWTNLTDAEGTAASNTFDNMTGFHSNTSTIAAYHAWMWKRAPGFFDIVAYTGDGIAGRTVDHNLGVVPEMIWVKSRSNAVDWSVYHEGEGNTKQAFLDLTNAFTASAEWDNTSPTTEVFSCSASSGVNQTSYTYIAYLFATLAGISKVGSFTGNGTTQTIDCGFTAGARFVLIKSTTDTGNWLFWDSTRGIVAGDDPHLALNSTAAEITTDDSIDPDNSGFVVNLDAGAAVLDQINISGKNYVFYSVA